MTRPAEESTMEDAELVVVGAVSADPMRHAPLVNDLVQDRLDRPARGLDPMIAARHGDPLIAHLAGLSGRLVPTGADAATMHAAARDAVARAIHHTHQTMMALGHLRTPEEQGALATGRVLFTAAVAGDAAAAMTAAMNTAN